MTRLSAVVLLVRFLLALAVAGALAVGYRGVGGGAGRPPWWSVVLAAVVVAVVLALAREPARRWSSRLVLGRSAGGYEAMRSLLQRIGTAVPVEDVLPRIAETAGRAVGRGPAQVRLWTLDGRASTVAGAAPTHGEPLTVGVRHAGTAVGEIAVDASAASVPPVSRRLLDELAGPAGLALSTVRLNLELRRRAEELAALNQALERSTARVQQARRIEQRRLRDAVAERVTPHVDDAAGRVVALDHDRLRAAAEQLDLAVDELRAIAHGVFPPRLTEDGVVRSLRGWSQQRGVPVDLTLDGDVDRLRRHPEVERCLYFCAVTLLDSLVADRADGLAVQLRLADDEVTLAVLGSSSPGADALLVVRDRVEAFDGGLDLGHRSVMRIPLGVDNERADP